MNDADRERFVKNFIEEHCFKVMAGKGKEYSRGERDVNSNFKRVAESTGMTPVQVAYVYLAKHLDSIAHFVKTGEEGAEGINGRIGDAVNYLLILASLIAEERPGVSDKAEHPAITAPPSSL